MQQRIWRRVDRSACTLKEKNKICWLTRCEEEGGRLILNQKEHQDFWLQKSTESMSVSSTKSVLKMLVLRYLVYGHSWYTFIVVQYLKRHCWLN